YPAAPARTRPAGRIAVARGGACAGPRTHVLEAAPQKSTMVAPIPGPWVSRAKFPVSNRIECGEPATALPGPGAWEVAGLRVEGDFPLVRQCGHPDCEPWFHGRTRSHGRHGCSLSTGGTRQGRALPPAQGLSRPQRAA